LYGESRRGLVITTCSHAARQHGIRVGMPLGEARALLPRPGSRGDAARAADALAPQILPASPVRDRADLQALALQCQQYSPLTGLEETSFPESLWLDIAGSEALFGGEMALIRTLQADLAKRGFQARIAIAQTFGTAWAVSHFSPRAFSVVSSGDEAAALAPLPVLALRLPEATVAALGTLNAATVGDLMRLPRASLPSRFGRELLARLDQALGQAPELLTAERLQTPLTAEWLLEEPCSDRQVLEQILNRLLEQVFQQLQQRQAGLREVRCHWLGTSLAPLTLRLLRPTTECRHVQELLRLRCERLTVTEPLRGIRLELVELGLPPRRQTRLFEDEAPAERQQQVLAELVDRLGSRLGVHSVLRPTLRPDPQPEYACECVPWPHPAPAPMPTASRSHLRCRPLCLLPSPQPLILESPAARGDRRDPAPPETSRSESSPPLESARVISRLFPPASIVRATGPERIETGWWRGPEEKRDYYRLELSTGSVVWAYFDRGTGRWLLHGLFT